MKRYRITIEELPGEAVPTDAKSPSASSSAECLEDITPGAEQSEGEHQGSLAKKVATTTAMMPMGVVEWLLNVSYDKPYGFRLPAAEKKEWEYKKEGGDDSAEAIAVAAVTAIASGGGVEDVVPQVHLPEQKPSSSAVITVLAAPSQQAPPTSESVSATLAGAESTVATKIEAPPAAVAADATTTTAVTASNFKAHDNAPVITPVNANPTETAPSSLPSSPSLLINKVMEVRPSWDGQDQTISTSDINNNAPQDSSFRTRQWPPRRRSNSEVQTLISHVLPVVTVVRKEDSSRPN
jgi:hypothetical protein